MSALTELCLLPLVAQQVLQSHAVHVADGQELQLVLPPDAEGPVHGEDAVAVPLVIVRHQGEHLVAVLGLRQRFAEGADLGADVPVIGPLPLGDGVVVRQDGEAVREEVLLQGGEVVVEELVENGEVALREAVHAAALGGAHPLAGPGEGVVVGHEDPGEVALPEVLVEAADGGEVQNAFNLRVGPLEQGLLGPAVLAVPDDVRQADQDAVRSQVAVEDEMGKNAVHSGQSFLAEKPPSLGRRRLSRIGLVRGGIGVGVVAPRRSKVRSIRNALTGIPHGAPLLLLSVRDPLRWARGRYFS